MGARRAPRRTGKHRDGWAHRRRPSDRERSSRKELGEKINRLERENKELREKLAERDRQVADAETQIAEQEKQIEDLERQLAGWKKNSRNSSKPPSSDRLRNQPRCHPQRKKSKRKPGGQKGHVGKHRPLVAPERVDEVRSVWPRACKHCQHPLAPEGEGLQTVGEPQRQQVTELPPIRAHIIEYQCPKVLCPACGKGTREPLPPEAVQPFGAQLTALIAYLTVVCRLPRRLAQECLASILGIPVSLGSTQKLWEETSEAVAAPYQVLEQQLRQEPVLNGDDTGWSNNGEKRHIWALVAQGFVYYTVAKTRSYEVLVYLLGTLFTGILCSDRGGAFRKYRRLYEGPAQYCWAHLKRNLLGILDFAKTTEAERFCRNALALHARLFRLWHRFQGGQIDREQLIDKSIPLQKRFFSLAVSHLDSQDRDVQNMATALYGFCHRLFVFLEHPGVEPTNNSSERALRIAVQWRKIIFGNRSEKGEVAVARLLTVSRTCLMQRRSALVYLAEAIHRHRCGQPPPPLLAWKQ